MRLTTWTLDSFTQTIGIGAGGLARITDSLPIQQGTGKVLVVSDSNVAPLYADDLIGRLRGAGGVNVDAFNVPAGEGSKTLRHAQLMYERLADLRLGRDGLIVALGGGVVTDLSGFVASTWLRGVKWVACPTSLEGAIDAAIGGKTGVNLPAGKNLVGTFYPASQVIIDPACFRTLARRDLIAGLAESIKHALIADEGFLSWHESARHAVLACDAAALEELIERNVAIKMDLVRRDFRETGGERARLNFGHTLGHAIEAGCGYALRHGECVALGMAAAAGLSRALGLLDAQACDRVLRVLHDFGLPTRWAELPGDDVLLAFLLQDKKAHAARRRWVLLEGIGRTVIRDDVPLDAVQAAIASLR